MNRSKEFSVTHTHRPTFTQVKFRRARNQARKVGGFTPSRSAASPKRINFRGLLVLFIMFLLEMKGQPDAAPNTHSSWQAPAE
jgi:hypothetical protein